MWASKIPCIVTESTTLPVIVPVIARAGAAGRATVRMRATSVELTARRTSAEVTGVPSSRDRRGAAVSFR